MQTKSVQSASVLVQVEVKEDLTTPPGLALYDSNKETTVSVDASSYGLGAVLQMQAEKEWKPVASRASRCFKISQ